MAGPRVGWSKSYMPIHLLAIAVDVLMILAIIMHLYPGLEQCRSLCEAYPAGCKYNGLLGCEFEFREQDFHYEFYYKVEYTFQGVIILIGVPVALLVALVAYLWISTLYVRVDEGGILIIKNLFLRKEIYIPRDEILDIHIKAPSRTGIWLRFGRSKAIIVHKGGKTAFALYSGDLVEFPRAVMEYLDIAPTTIESAL